MKFETYIYILILSGTLNSVLKVDCKIIFGVKNC